MNLSLDTEIFFTDIANQLFVPDLHQNIIIFLIRIFFFLLAHFNLCPFFGDKIHVKIYNN